MATIRYEADDGKLFDSLEKAERYEKLQIKLGTAVRELGGMLYDKLDFTENLDTAEGMIRLILTDRTILVGICKFVGDLPARGQEKD